ncbi:MAG: (2Fe-2S)-binding protein [Candidatus Riflebacteria bacterium]|nr:(2Fe-2S)-binding protein [Candidatus Riflebacteria bacterium]
MKIIFTLNGKKVEAETTAQMTLLELLRQNFKLTAAKEGCGKGECGACTVFLNGSPINSCLKLAATLNENDSITTVEGLEEDKLMQRIRQSFTDEGAVQCGFCIPGMTLATHHLLSKNPKPSLTDIKTALAGNICRCTGYRKIEAAVKNAADKGE